MANNESSDSEWFIHRFRCRYCDALTRADRQVKCFRCGSKMEHEEKIGSVQDSPQTDSPPQGAP